MSTCNIRRKKVSGTVPTSKARFFPTATEAQIMAFGTGMTRRGMVEFDWGIAGDADLHVQAAVELFSRSSFDRRSRRLENLAERILSDAGLPHDHGAIYTVASPSFPWRRSRSFGKR